VRITGYPELILHSRKLLAETLLQTALRAMIQFHLSDKSDYRKLTHYPDTLR